MSKVIEVSELSAIFDIPKNIEEQLNKTKPTENDDCFMIIPFPGFSIKEMLTAMPDAFDQFDNMWDQPEAFITQNEQPTWITLPKSPPCTWGWPYQERQSLYSNHGAFTLMSAAQSVFLRIALYHLRSVTLCNFRIWQTSSASSLMPGRSIYLSSYSPGAPMFYTTYNPQWVHETTSVAQVNLSLTL